MLSALAQAHFSLLQPRSALATDDGGKGAPPCGEGTPSNIVTAAQGGRPIAIRLKEFVFHPGHYRFALSVNSRAELPPDPEVVVDSNGNSVSAPIQNPVKAPVLADGVFAHASPASGDFETSITLPNLTCEKCTLQVIEFMAEHGPNPGGGYYYHHCADLRITADPALPPADSAWPRTAGQNSATVPYIATGASLYLVNTSASAIPADITFRGDDGSALGVANATVEPNATVAIPIGDSSAPAARGWAEVISPAALSGFAVVRSSGGEAAVPLQALTGSSLSFPFDNTDGSATTIAIVNLAATAANFTMTVWDERGNRIAAQPIALGSSARVEIALPSRIPETAGIRGLVRFQGPEGAALAGQALRTGASGAMSALPLLQ